MIVSIIAAVSENGVIGREGKLPWHLPADLKRFRQLTTGHWIIMGRRTWESLGRPLPERTSVVITRDPEYRAEGAIVVHSLDEAIQLAAAHNQAEVFIIGGAEIYRQALPRADRLYLTIVHARVEGDTLFPILDESTWQLKEQARHPADIKNASGYSFCRYERRASL